MKMRIGHGYDVHAFTQGDHVILGGVRIAHSKGLLAHSDGDVLLHAICDACLGAAGLGDIGRHFPDTDELYRDVSSLSLLDMVYQQVLCKDLCIVNIDVTVIAQVPKLSGHIDQMQQQISRVLMVKEEQVNIKATTTERLGYIGREEGIAVHAVVLLTRKECE